MPDTYIEDPGTLTALLLANRARREQAVAQVAEAKDELRNLLLRGQSIAMDVADMADKAGVSRDTAHRILKEAGTMSWKQKRAWADEVLAAVPRGDLAQNKFRMMLQMNLYNALGAKPEDMPRTVNGILERTANDVRTIGGETAFQPNVDAQRLAQIPTWPSEPFEIIQNGTRDEAVFQLRLHGVSLAPWRATADEVARDLKEHGGIEPTYIDRTGPECTTADGRRIGWAMLQDLA